MRNQIVLAVAISVVGLTTAIAEAGNPIAAIQRAHADRGAQWHNTNQSWHQNYQHVQWGHPVALIVPPTASFQTQYSWGVGRTQMLPIHHQFGRPIATSGGGSGTSPTPRWPWSTQQMGVSSVRGPW